MKKHASEIYGTDIDFPRMYHEIYGSFTYNDGMPMDPETTALVIVDMQPALTISDYGMMKAYSKILNVGMEYMDDRVKNLLIPNHRKLLELFREKRMMVVYIVTWSETDDLSDMPAPMRRSIHQWEAVLGEQVYRKWNDGMQVYDDIAPEGHELVLPKRSGSAFASSMLPYCLNNAGIKTVVLTGCNTNGCVFQTAVVGKNLGYDFLLVKDATACFAPVLQNQAESWIAAHYGIVRTADETIALFNVK